MASLGEHYGTTVRLLFCTRSQDWRGAAAAVAAAAGVHAATGVAPPVVLVAGGKGVGKSTLCRLVVNALLSCPACPMGVAVLDADCGQPELGLPGTPLGSPRSCVAVGAHRMNCVEHVNGSLKRRHPKVLRAPSDFVLKQPSHTYMGVLL